MICHVVGLHRSNYRAPHVPHQHTVARWWSATAPPRRRLLCMRHRCAGTPIAPGSRMQRRPQGCHDGTSWHWRLPALPGMLPPAALPNQRTCWWGRGSAMPPTAAWLPPLLRQPPGRPSALHPASTANACCWTRPCPWWPKRCAQQPTIRTNKRVRCAAGAGPTATGRHQTSRQRLQQTAACLAQGPCPLWPAAWHGHPCD